ncbi:MAG: FAD-binding oxidoreductase [Paracoccaceae bacterium]|nr:FAD-binding oxidoreductase [Paracoccaceae bacterium]
MNRLLEYPTHQNYDIIIIGGALYGSSIAWFLSNNPDFSGTILVIEKDPSYEFSSTIRTNSCIRQQFSQKINIEISQFGAHYINNFRNFMNNNPQVPELNIQAFGYMYLASTKKFAKILKQNQKIQQASNSKTRFMTASEIKRQYPFYNVDDIIAGNHNLVDEGYFDGNTIFNWWKKSAKKNNVEYIKNEVSSLKLSNRGNSIESVHLKSGDQLSCNTIVNASGPYASKISSMIGIKLPVEPRKRYSFVFQAEKNLQKLLPLTIDPSGIHMRSDGQYYLAGCPPDHDPRVDYNDFSFDHSIWEDKVWPILAHRIPQFESIRLKNSWVGHYAYNVLDQNAIVGYHTKIKNFIFANGFSGHGFQQSPAIGRGISELIIYNQFKTLDLSPFNFSRIEAKEPFIETAII